MRIVNEIVHPSCKITVYHWNNRYIVKLEQQELEQTFKVNALDLEGESDVNRLVNPDFINECLDRFNSMREQLYRSLESL